MDSSTSLWPARATPRRVSQDPRRLSRRAPSPLVPDGSMGASARCFPIDGRLQHLRKTGRRHWFNETESGSRPLGSRLRSSDRSAIGAQMHARTRTRSVSRGWLPAHVGPLLHAERAIHMADSFQSARVARVGLAQPEKRSSGDKTRRATAGRNGPERPAHASVCCSSLLRSTSVSPFLRC